MWLAAMILYAVLLDAPFILPNPMGDSWLHRLFDRLGGDDE